MTMRRAILYDRCMQPTQQATGNSLQGSSSTLQQQDTTTQYQQTGGVGQDALGPEQYQDYDKLSVQGTPSGSTGTAVTAGTNSPEVILLVMLLVVIAGMLVLRKYLFKSKPTKIPEILATNEQPVSVDVPINTTKPKKKKSSKKAASKVKKPTKKAKKSSKK